MTEFIECGKKKRGQMTEDRGQRSDELPWSSYSYSSSSSSLVRYKILISEHENEDEYEKYQIRSPESVLI